MIWSERAASVARFFGSPGLFLAYPMDYNSRLTPPPNLTAAMKVLSSLKSAKQRHRDCKIVRRRGKVFVICKSNPRFKARQR